MSAAGLFISEALSSDEAGGTVVEKNVRKGKPSEKMGRKATDPTGKTVGKQSCRAGHSAIVISGDVEWKRHLCQVSRVPHGAEKSKLTEVFL